MDTSKSKLSTSILRNQRFCKPIRSWKKIVTKNALPILAYYDIFKNFYANTQEDNFYIIGAANQLKGIRHNNGTNPLPIPLPVNYILHQGQAYEINDVESDETGEHNLLTWQEPTGGAITTKTATKNALPILAYYDIFKNFYANTQEDNFYIIGKHIVTGKQIGRAHV